jgi:hypothetical protein
MIKKTLKVGLYCLLAATLANAPSIVCAQDMPAQAEKKERPKNGAQPFHGKLKSVDATARTITFGETTVQITDDTKLMKNGAPAKLEDAVVGESVAGTYRKQDGKAIATMVRFGPKPESASDETVKKQKKKKSAE